MKDNKNSSHSSDHYKNNGSTEHDLHVKAGHLGGSSAHECRGRQCSSKEKENKSGKTDASTDNASEHERHQKAGHLGGSAKHSCRGRECSSNESESKKSWWNSIFR